MLKRYVVGAILWAGVFAGALAAQVPGPIDFRRDVQPLLKAQCYGCHGPSQQMNHFRLDRRNEAMPNRVGANGATIVPGNSAGSRLYLKLIGNQSGLQMPPAASQRRTRPTGAEPNSC